MTVSILCGDCRDMLRQMPAESVHCVVTSPPYWGLRDYGIAGQLGLEASLGEYVDVMVDVFREVRRVLRKDGTLWLNLGDSYAAGGRGCGADGSKQQTNAGSLLGPKSAPDGLKPKDLCGIPWRVAFALQADGWWLRQDLIWSKPNPMPESVTDRCTKAHEYLFLLSKNERYFYDAEAIAEETVYDQRLVRINSPKNLALGLKPTREYDHVLEGGRNKRSVWEVTTQPFSEAHFATFPPALIEPCIKAGTSEKGCCARCWAPWRRHLQIEERPNAPPNCNSQYPGYRGISGGVGNDRRERIDNGWSPSCACNAEAAPCTVLDPFAGAGTTGLVADRLQRNAILIELKPEYAAMARRRIEGDAPLFTQVEDYNATDDFARSIEEAR